MDLVIEGQQVTMSSLELVEFINEDRRLRAESGKEFSELRHSDFMRKCLDVIGEGVRNFSDTHRNHQNGQIYVIYRFPKRESCLMAMSYSYELQAKVFDRMSKLEDNQAKPAELSRMDILKIAMDAEQGRLEAEKKLAIAAPKVAFVENYVQAKNGSMGLREVCKVLRAKENEFVSFLLERGFMYRTTKESPLTPKADHIHNGRFEAKTGVSRTTEHAFVHYKFTSKGVEWIAGEWGKNQVRELF